MSHPHLVMRIKHESPSDLTICSVVVSELTYGAERASPGHQASNRMKVDLLRQQFVSLPFDDPAAETCGIVRAHLGSLGTPIGPNDLMVASIALSNKWILVTHNTSEFSRVPDCCSTTGSDITVCACHACRAGLRRLPRLRPDARSVTELCHSRCGGLAGVRCLQERRQGRHSSAAERRN